MASNGEFTVVDALNILENLTETNGNLRNEVNRSAWSDEYTRRTVSITWSGATSILVLCGAVFIRL